MATKTPRPATRTCKSLGRPSAARGTFLAAAVLLLAGCGQAVLKGPAGSPDAASEAGRPPGGGSGSSVPWTAPSGNLNGLTPGELVEEGRRRGLDLEIPFELDEGIERDVEEAIGLGGTPVDRIRRIIRFMNDKGHLNFQYTQNVSLTASRAFHEGRGDCLAYTNLFMGIARHLKIPAYFVHIRESRDYYERDGLFFISSHMAVGYGGGGVGRGIGLYTVIVDFTQETSGTGLALYHSVDDTAATVLFYNNVAVDHLMAGDVSGSERLIRFLIEARPDIQEIQNNLGVILLRQGRYEEALAVLDEAVRRFPGYQPLYTNGIQAAKGAHKPHRAKQYEEEGLKWTRKDPFFIFNQGVEHYRAARYAEAASCFERAVKLRPDNPSLEAWLARSYLASKRDQKGLQAFLKAQALSPNFPMLDLLRKEFPALSSVPRVLILPQGEEEAPRDAPAGPAPAGP